MDIKKIIYLVCGILTCILGAIGAILPILPTVPFLLLAAFCFGKCSVRLEHWFKSTGLYKNHLDDFTRGDGMKRGTKCRVITTITILLGVGFMMMSEVPVARGVLVVVWVSHIVYFTFKVKTIHR